MHPPFAFTSDGDCLRAKLRPDLLHSLPDSSRGVASREWDSGQASDFTYREQTWGAGRRAVAKIERHDGEHSPRIGFIETFSKLLAGEGVRCTTDATMLTTA